MVVPVAHARERPAAGAHVRRHQHGVLAVRHGLPPAGRIFIRRDTKDVPVYRWVLRQYLGYLVEKRFTLEWYIEGTRSRTGKLGPPKMGLLRYIADACREGRTDDVAMVPVSIIYDQLHEVGEFAAEATGSTKKTESLGWIVKSSSPSAGDGTAAGSTCGSASRSRCAEPSTRCRTAGRTTSPTCACRSSPSRSCTRINAVTPITASALVCLVLLATRGQALTARELHLSLTPARPDARSPPSAGGVGGAARDHRGRAPRRRVARRQPRRSRSTTPATSPSTGSAEAITSPPRSTATRSSTTSSAGRSASWRSSTPPSRTDRRPRRGVLGGGSTSATCSSSTSSSSSARVPRARSPTSSAAGFRVGGAAVAASSRRAPRQDAAAQRVRRPCDRSSRRTSSWPGAARRAAGPGDRPQGVLEAVPRARRAVGPAGARAQP